MKYSRQLSIIMLVSFIGEALKYFLPFPIPASVYGLVLMFILLTAGIVKLESVKETAKFLIVIMPILLVPTGAGIISCWDRLSQVLLPVVLAIVGTTTVIMIVTGKVTQAVINAGRGNGAQAAINPGRESGAQSVTDAGRGNGDQAAGAASDREAQS